MLRSPFDKTATRQCVTALAPPFLLALCFPEPFANAYGAFNELYDKADGRALSDHLQTTSSKYYGVAGIEYLTRLVAETRDLDAQFDDAKKKLIGDEKLRVTFTNLI
jgi:hypothetical protein